MLKYQYTICLNTVKNKKTTGSLWKYYSNEPNNHPVNNDNPPTVNYNADPITNSESLKYKSSITGETSNAN